MAGAVLFFFMAFITMYVATAMITIVIMGL
jgi:hypothetical protein